MARSMRTRISLAYNREVSTDILLNTETKQFKFVGDEFRKRYIGGSYISYFDAFIGRPCNVKLLNTESEVVEVIPFVNEKEEYCLFNNSRMRVEINNIEQIETIQAYRGDIQDLICLWKL